MSKANEPAFPQWIEIVSDTTTRVSGGITKRELFAAMPKVGTWVEDADGPRLVVEKNEKDNPFCSIPRYLLHPEEVGNEYEPCPPPPLVAALEAWASDLEEVKTRYNGLISDIGENLLREYRKLFPKGGGK